MASATGPATSLGEPFDDRFAAELRGFGPVRIVAMLAIVLTGGVSVGTLVVPVGAFLVLAWARWSRTPWREIGYARPRNWIGTLIAGLIFGIAFKLLMKTIVMPVLGAEPINQAFHYLAGNRPAIPATLFSMIVAAGFGEETMFRGYLFERLGKLLGDGVGAKTSIVLFTSIWFGLAHYADQGLAGAEQGTITGLVFGTIAAVAGRIWMPIIAHAAFDLTAYAIIYWNVESAVAHLVFR